MPQIFRFKQFSVGQSGCAMKINTDGVLLGAIANAENPIKLLDIGTGTGVIALMLAQRFRQAEIHAVEIDTSAAKTAAKNFESSVFHQQLHIYPDSIENYFTNNPDEKFDLIVSNPPFYIDSLKSPGERKSLAKHTDIDFFEKLTTGISNHITPKGVCWMIIPAAIAEIVTDLAGNAGIFPQKIIHVQSYQHSAPHRFIVCLGFDKILPQIITFTIYKEAGVYSEEYQRLLQPYFIAF